MRKIYIIFLIQFALSVVCYSQNLKDKLDSLSKLYNFTVEELKVDSLFEVKYLLQFKQVVDHQNPEGVKFSQRVFLSHLDFNKPVVFITEGYTAWHAENPKFVSELAGLLHTNQICVEHRYFGTSIPEPLKWDYLTVSNAAADHHRIIEVLKLLYNGKWINTGISKGGQTTMYHRFFYPEDVDISVPYVAPLNFSVEEQRVYMFLDSVGSKFCRERIFQFQKELMQNKADYIDEFEKLAQEKKLTYRMGIEKAYDLTVFEYSFAFWQWGYFTCEQIPGDITSKEKLIKHLDDVAGMKWISNEGIEDLQPFFYQAIREMGFYGYDISPFKEWTTFTKNPTFEFSLPEGVSVDYSPHLMEEVDFFIRHKANNMIFIYGEYDPWSAPAVELTYHTNSIKIVKPKGSHRTRINNLPESQKRQVINTLMEWLEQ